MYLKRRIRKSFVALTGILIMVSGVPGMTANAENMFSKQIYGGLENTSDRALTAVTTNQGALVSWRYYPEDGSGTEFTLKRNGLEVYRGSNTNYFDRQGRAGDRYNLEDNSGRNRVGLTTSAWKQEYLELTLKAPDPQTMPDGSVTDYTANDMSVGDLNGDGRLELIVKWYPDNAQDNSIDGYTGTTFLDAYDIDTGTGAANLMWRIDLGVNIRSGAHYTQFQVWDYDGDGCAEVMVKTADGSTTYQNVNGSLKETGHVGAVSAKALPTNRISEKYDFRSSSGRIGRIVKGDEYLTAFDGRTGKIIDTTAYLPSRGIYNAQTGIWDTSMWGLDSKGNKEPQGYANRVDRFLAATAYLDGTNPSAVFCRGYYGRTAIAAWDLKNGKLTRKWLFDVPTGDKYAGQGNHNLSINDVDGDGKDEIIYGSLTLDHDGKPKYTTGLGHGDAMHVSDWNDDGRLEVFQVHEEKNAQYHVELHDAETGKILWGYQYGKDTGRGVAADIDPRYPGAEMWAAVNAITYNAKGERIYEEGKRPSQNFSIFWDGDLLMELFDSNNSTQLIPQVQKWDYENQKTDVLIQMNGTLTNNGTKSNACLVADIIGDWREEVIVRDAQDKNKIRIYSTPIETSYRVPCLLTDRAYREGVAWQNTAYNQPANLSYLLSSGIKVPEITGKQLNSQTMELNWTAGSDGKYGHQITGYAVYRAELGQNFRQIGTVGESNRSYRDSGLTQGVEYRYQVAAIVDGVSSFRSFPVTGKTQ